MAAHICAAEPFPWFIQESVLIKAGAILFFVIF